MRVVWLAMAMAAVAAALDGCEEASVTLSNGLAIPKIGFGCAGHATAASVEAALVYPTTSGRACRLVGFPQVCMCFFIFNETKLYLGYALFPGELSATRDGDDATRR